MLRAAGAIHGPASHRNRRHHAPDGEREDREGRACLTPRFARNCRTGQLLRTLHPAWNSSPVRGARSVHGDWTCRHARRGEPKPITQEELRRYRMPTVIALKDVLADLRGDPDLKNLPDNASVISDVGLDSLE